MRNPPKKVGNTTKITKNVATRKGKLYGVQLPFWKNRYGSGKSTVKTKTANSVCWHITDAVAVLRQTNRRR